MGGKVIGDSFSFNPYHPYPMSKRQRIDSGVSDGSLPMTAPMGDGSSETQESGKAFGPSHPGTADNQPETGGGGGGPMGNGAVRKIPSNDHWPTERTYKFGVTRGFYWDSTSNAVGTPVTMSERPVGYAEGGAVDIDNNGCVQLPWNYIPNNNMMLYMTPNDVTRMYQDGMYMYRVKKIKIHGYNASCAITLPQSATVMTSVDKPVFYEYTDHKRLFQNQSDYRVQSDLLTAYDNTPNFNVNVGQILQETGGVGHFSTNYKPMLQVQYWIPGPTANYSVTPTLIGLQNPLD